MEVTNLTGHDVTVYDFDGRKEVIETGTGRARMISRTTNVGVVQIGEIEVPLLEIDERALVELPDYDGLFIVSGLVAAHASRPDFIVPARLIRDPNQSGRVVGCRAFARIRSEVT